MVCWDDIVSWVALFLHSVTFTERSTQEPALEEQLLPGVHGSEEYRRKHEYAVRRRHLLERREVVVEAFDACVVRDRDEQLAQSLVEELLQRRARGLVASLVAPLVEKAPLVVLPRQRWATQHRRMKEKRVRESVREVHGPLLQKMF